MKIRPILFSTPMVQAILEGRKTQTRRIIRPQPKDDLSFLGWKLPEYVQVDFGRGVKTDSFHKFPFGQVGDVLWVRETFRPKSHSFPIGEHFEYKATAQADGNPTDEPWKPSIFMPKDAARIWLKITDVRVERLKDISEEDSIAEGCSKYGPFNEYRGSLHPNSGAMKFRAYSNPIDAYKCVWLSINGENSWNKNPWVWVIEFERIEKPIEL